MKILIIFEKQFSRRTILNYCLIKYIFNLIWMFLNTCKNSMLSKMIVILLCFLRKKKCLIFLSYWKFQLYFIFTKCVVSEEALKGISFVMISSVVTKYSIRIYTSFKTIIEPAFFLHTHKFYVTLPRDILNSNEFEWFL